MWQLSLKSYVTCSADPVCGAGSKVWMREGLLAMRLSSEALSLCFLCPEALPLNLGNIHMLPPQVPPSPYQYASHYPVYFLSQHLLVSEISNFVCFSPSCELHKNRDNICPVHHFTTSTWNDYLLHSRWSITLSK